MNELRDFPTSAHLTPSKWLDDWTMLNYRATVQASYSNDPELLVRAVRSAAHSSWANRELIIERAVQNQNFPPVLASFVLRYWSHPFSTR